MAREKSYRIHATGQADLSGLRKNITLVKGVREAAVYPDRLVVRFLPDETSDEALDATLRRLIEGEGFSLEPENE